MKNSSKDSDKKKNYLDLEKEKKKTGKTMDLPKSPNKGAVKKK